MQSVRFVKIKNVAEVSTGFTARGKIAVGSQGHLFVQLKDIGAGDSINSIEINALERSADLDYKEAHLVAEGDLIFRSRGHVLVAAVVPPIAEPVGIISPLIRLCVDHSQAMPEFLCWVINNTPGQSYFSSQAAGSAVKMIGKSALVEMEVPLPALEVQKRIVELSVLQKKEENLSMKINRKNKQLVNNRIMRFLEDV